MKLSLEQLEKIKSSIIEQAQMLGFQDARVSNTSTIQYMPHFKSWVEQNFHGDMYYLENNQELRETPEKLHPNTIRVISLRYDYLPKDANFTLPLRNSDNANISRYALGRDYHKLLRKKLNQLCKNIKQLHSLSQLDSRVFVDSAPVLETAFAEKSGLGWKGKHTLIINKEAGSWFFLGEIFINLALPIDQPEENLCGQCTSCIKLCPTDAIIAPNKLDAKRCISYLTIENQGAIPIELRKKIGNRIYGCDDCQLACPWNRYSTLNQQEDFQARYKLDTASLLDLWSWTEEEFLKRLEGSPIRRIGYQNWLRNLAVAIGNSEYSAEKIAILKNKSIEVNVNDIVAEHIDWAIQQLLDKQAAPEKLSQKNKKLINCVTNMMPRDA